MKAQDRERRKGGGARMDHTLGSLIAPTLPEVFFRDHWQRQPLVVSRGEPGTYAHLVSLRDVDSLIYFGRPAFLQASGSSPAEGVPHADSVVKGGLPGQGRPAPSAGAPDLPSLRQSYNDGKTVYVH